MPDQEIDNPTSFDAQGELPRWLRHRLQSAAAVPGAARHLTLWMPTLTAAWRAGRQGLAVANALRTSLDDRSAPPWPDDLIDDFLTTVDHLGQALPGLDEALPSVTGLVDLGQDLVDPQVAHSLVIDGLAQAERGGEKLVARLVDAAFFAAHTGDTARRTRDLRQLFLRLESLFDRALQLWLVQQDPQEPSP